MTNRREIFTFLGAAIAAGAANPAKAAAAADAAVADAVLDADQSKLSHEPFGELRIYFEGPTDQLKLLSSGSLRLNPGATPHEPHKHPEEEVMMVTEGSGEISLNGKITPCREGSMMYCAANHLHGIVNTGETPLTFYWAKWETKA